jgi:hypothetical protein
MPDGPPESPWSSAAGPDLLNLASSVLAREASRMASPLAMPASPSAASGTAPVGPWGASPEGGPGAWPAAAGLGTEIHRLGALAEPVIGATVPVPPPDLDLLRRRSHEFIESLLVTFSQATGEKAAPYEDQVPLLRCMAPIESGGEAVATMVVANDEDTPSEVSLYCTNFVADSGHEIASVRVTVSPRMATISPRGQAAFEIRVAVPQQAAAGTYSGLIQATRSKYVKAVLSLEVL